MSFGLIHNLLRKGKSFIWSCESQEAFEQMKTFLNTQPILAFFDSDFLIQIYTYLIFTGIGTILTQLEFNKNSKTEPSGIFFHKTKCNTKKL